MRCPQRTCLGCRQVRPKAALIRLARQPDGFVVVDRAGTKPGRGAYMCWRPECVEGALKRGRLARAFKEPAEPSAEVAALLQEAAASPREQGMAAQGR